MPSEDLGRLAAQQRFIRDAVAGTEKAERPQKIKLIVVTLQAFGGGYYACDRLAPEYTAISVVLVAGLMLWFASRGFWPPIPPDCLFCKRDTDARFNAVPIAIAQVADRSQLGAMYRQNIRRK